jgi:dipeptide/tripeptide permease
MAPPAAPEKLRLGPTLRALPAAFYTANLMEVFERMAWYGFFAVSSNYLTGPVAEGGLGLTAEQRGVIQAIVPFLLYLFPVFTGALADRFGYFRTFFVAYSILLPGYWMLGQPRGFWGFFFVFLVVAVGAALFKPLVVGTVARTTGPTTESLGFGIFYLIVNIGGFLGPVISGLLRNEFGWPAVFKASALWIALNFAVLFLFYREPKAGHEHDRPSSTGEKLRGAVDDMVRVIGNGRLFVTALVGLVLLMLAGGDWISWRLWAVLTAAWVGGNLLLDAVLRRRGPAGRAAGDGRGMLAPMRIGDGAFVVYLLLVAGFWAIYEQLFITLPEYIRDFTNTDDILLGLRGGAEALGLTGMAERMDALLAEGFKVNPEWIVNVDSFAIILLQIPFSAALSRVAPFRAIVAGTLITAVAMATSAGATTGWLACLVVLIFSFGEMTASPKTFEYVSSVAPKDKSALYMGYYFVSTALGNLFAGLLSGQAYGKLARDLRRPDLMWLLFALIAVVTAGALWVYDRRVIRPRAARAAAGAG